MMIGMRGGVTMSLTYVLKVLKLIGVLCVAWFYAWLLKKHKQLSAKEKQEKIIVKKSKSNHRIFHAYSVFSRFKVTRRFLNRFVKVYAIRIPGDYRRAREEATKTIILMWSISIICIVAAFIFGGGLYMISCACLAAVVACKSIATSKLEKYDLQIIRELSIFVDDVRHYYYELRMVPEAIKEAMENSGLSLMKQHAQKIYEVLTSDDTIAAAKNYNNSITDYYLRLFMATSVVIEHYGDREIDGDLLYVLSLRDLKRDIQTEMIRRRMMSSKFMALPIVAVLPFFTLAEMENYFSGMFSTLKDLYFGTYGSIAKAVFFIVTIIIYTIINMFRDTVKVENDNARLFRKVYSFPSVKKIVDSQLNKNWGKTLRLRSLLKRTGNNLDVYAFTTKRMMLFVVCFIVAVVFLFGAKMKSKPVYLNGAIQVTQSTSGASDADCFEMYLLTDHYIQEYSKTDWRRKYNSTNHSISQVVDDEVEEFIKSSVLSDLNSKSVTFNEEESYSAVETFLDEFEGTKLAISKLRGVSYQQACSSSDIMIQSGIKNYRTMLTFAGKANCFLNRTELAQSIADTVANKIRKSQNVHFGWIDLVIAFLFAVCAYFEPIVVILAEKKALQMDMQDEVIQYDALILILMHIDRIAQEDVLEWMCMFARIFKPSLQKALCNYTLMNDEALNILLEDEPFEPFRRIIEDIKMIDKNGILVAFNGIAGDRKNYQEDRKIENEISINNKAVIAQFLAMAPAWITVIGYLVVPLAIAAFGGIGSAISQLNDATGS